MALEEQDHFEVRMYGVMHNQAVNNTINYWMGTGADTPSIDALTSFRALWRANILTIVSEHYRVLTYEIRKIAGAVWNKPDPLVPATWSAVWRYSDVATLEGVAITDAGQLDTAAFPSYVAVNVRKACGNYTDFAFADLPLEKVPRGALRIGGIPEDDTDVTDSNAIAAAALTSWNNAVEAFLEWDHVGTAAIFNMEVVSLRKNRDWRYTPPIATSVPEPARAPVSSLSVSPYLSSQVSRKQTVSNLG